jgi:glycerol-3-phosphate acyltransferase PlsY
LLYASIALIVFGYLLGSVPFGLIFSKVLYRTDIRKHGSGNIGATNVYRTLGPIAGILVLSADVLKALIPVLAAKYLLASDPNLLPTVSVLTGLAAIMGHSYPIFLGFSGGKGMATAAGLVIALWPWVALILFIIWITMLAVFRYSSLASITLAVSLPIFVSMLYPKTEYIVLSLIAAVVLVFRHRTNISRLIAGTELKLGKKSLEEE